MNNEQNNENSIQPALKQADVMGSYDDGIFYGIQCCNADYQQVIQQMYKDFISLKRINKADMKRILTQYIEIELGEDVNPFLEDVSE